MNYNKNRLIYIRCSSPLSYIVFFSSSIILYLISLKFLPIVSFLGLFPLFYFEFLKTENSKNSITPSLLFYFVLVACNLIATYWIFRINTTASILIVLINSLFFSFPFFIYRIIKKNKGYTFGFIAFISLWISIEYFHQHWELAFPYMTIGYILAPIPEIIQWYEYTGVLGGTLWVLVINLLFFNLIRIYPNKKQLVWNGVVIFLFISVPIIFSITRFNNYSEPSSKVNITIVHPNSDCYNYRYKVNPEQLIQDYFRTVNLTNSIDYLIWPETAITTRLLCNELNNTANISSISDTLKRYPNLKIISGAIINEKKYFQPYDNTSNIPHLLYNSEYDYFYYSYSAAIQVGGENEKIPFHTKKRLVPFEETIPYPKILFSMGKYIKSLGNFKFTFKQEDDNIFRSKNSQAIFAPIICYESLFGEDIAQSVRDGANIFAVILNEGWYNDMSASQKFVYFSIVRAIENRRSIARSSNRGISCFINQKGIVTKEIRSEKSGSIQSTLSLNDHLSFYSKYSNIIGVISTSVFLVIMFFILMNLLFRVNNSK